MSELSIPFANYLHLIREKRRPYYDLLRYVVADMERYYLTLEYREGVIYIINLRQLQREMREKMSGDKLTTVTIARTILAVLYGSKLRKDEDYYVTTTTGGRRNYHVKLCPRVLSIFRRYI